MRYFALNELKKKQIENSTIYLKWVENIISFYQTRKGLEIQSTLHNMYISI